MHVTNDYMLLSARFASVRRAWKRNAALGGLAVVVTEGVGLFTVLLFLDWLYQPQPLVRLAFSGAALIGLGWLVARHVVKPLLRKIPDEQIALYIEEHRTGLEGVLITAAEFGKKREGVTDRQASLIDAVIAQASQRSAKMQIASIADFSRLKKYGIGAVGGICVYALLGVLFPETFAHHFGRVLAPWHATEEDVARHDAAVAQSEPLRFTLSKGDASLARGSSFDLEVTLSKAKPTGQSVVINFRPKAGGDWQQLPMTEIEKLNGFQGTLPDVSEDLEFFIACGTDKSDTFHLTVFDPLVVQSLETTVHLPDYLKQPDEVTRPSTGDVTAVAGSTVTLRVLTSTTLKDGQIKWNDGTTQPMTVDPKAPDTETVSFQVSKDATYDYTASDVIGQIAVSPASMTVHAVPDLPPTVQVKVPQQSPVLSNMVGEVNFVVDAGDDFGVEGLDFVYSRVDAQGKSVETRVPLTIAPVDSKDSPHPVEASYHLQLEDFNPPVQPNDAITYHFEARDAKGQKAISPLGFIIIGAFEQWGTWAAAGAESKVHNETGADLMAVMAMVWDLNNDKPQLSPDDFTKQCAQVAGKMVDAQGNVLGFVDLSKMPQLAKVEPLITLHVKNAHDALVKQDSATATAEMSIAAALFVGNGILADTNLHSASAPQSTAGSHFTSPQLTMLEQARLDALSAAAPDKSRKEDEQSQAAAAAAAAKRIADLVNQQDALLAKAQAESAAKSQPDTKDAASKANAMPSAGATGKGSSSQGSSADAKNADLAKAQQDLADKTRAAAQASQGGSGGGGMQSANDKTGAAAKLMDEAARAFAAGKNSEGQDKAAQAKAALQSAGAELQKSDRDKLEADISAARGHAAVLLDKLKDLNASTSALAGQLNGKAPDQKGQRDLEKQAYQQTQLGAQAEALNDEIASLNARAQQNGQEAVQRALSDTQHVVRRNSPQAKLASAAVDLHNGNAGSADGEQKSAIDSLQKIVDGLNAGSDALAATRDAQLKRAQRLAQDARAGLASLAGSAGGQQAKAGDKGGDTKAGDNAPGAKAQTGDAPGAKAQSGGAMTSGGGEDQARDLADKITQLAAVTDNRDLIKQDLVDQLKQLSMDKAELEKKLMTDPKFLKDATDIVGSVRDKIEAELDAKTQAGKLYSSQREECPPSYRQFVNQYFEDLSHVAPAPGTAPAPAPTPAPQQ